MTFACQFTISRISDKSWIGLSELHTWGMYRWATGASLSWADWELPPQFFDQDPCVYIESSGRFKVSQCSNTYPGMARLQVESGQHIAGSLEANKGLHPASPSSDVQCRVFHSHVGEK